MNINSYARKRKINPSEAMAYMIRGIGTIPPAGSMQCTAQSSSVYFR